MPAMSKENSFAEIKHKDLPIESRDKTRLSHGSSYEPADKAHEIYEYATQLPQTGTSSLIYRPIKNELCKCIPAILTEVKEETKFVQNRSLQESKNDSCNCMPEVCGNVSTIQISSKTKSSQNSGKSSEKNHVSISSKNNNSDLAVIKPAKKSANDFIFGKFIGEGSFSTVYLGIEISTKREYAIKVCEKRHIIRENKQEYIKREREVMHMLTNVPGFVNLRCTFQDNRNLFFVMTYAKNGDLLPFINKVGCLGLDCARHYAAEILLSCEEMHSRNIIHRDLKPENILLDENMHTLIADFGSAKILTLNEKALVEAMLTKYSLDGAASSCAMSCDNVSFFNFTKPSTPNLIYDSEDNKDESITEMLDSTYAKPALQRRRKRCDSFVGTAQYVSPEVLQNGHITPMADLWAFGCILYQMISGLPPFRGDNEFFIFKKILACNVEFPEKFDKDAKDLVKKLLRIEPADRLGAEDKNGCYNSIRKHQFFSGIDFQLIRQRLPPTICPNLPAIELHDLETDQMEPGLCNKQLTRVLGMELGCSLGANSENLINSSKFHKIDVPVATEKVKSDAVNCFNMGDKTKIKLLNEQKTDKWHVFTDNEVMIKKGLVNNCRGLFAQKQMLILTTGPRLFYIDPVRMVKKGEIPWGPHLQVEPKNIRTFFINTPERTYYFEDTEGFGLDWVDTIEKLHIFFFPIFINPYLRVARSFPYNFASTLVPFSSTVPLDTPSTYHLTKS